MLCAERGGKLFGASPNIKPTTFYPIKEHKIPKGKKNQCTELTYSPSAFHALTS